MSPVEPPPSSPVTPSIIGLLARRPQHALTVSPAASGARSPAPTATPRRPRQVQLQPARRGHGQGPRTRAASKRLESIGCWLSIYHPSISPRMFCCLIGASYLSSI